MGRWSYSSFKCKLLRIEPDEVPTPQGNLLAKSRTAQKSQQYKMTTIKNGIGNKYNNKRQNNINNHDKLDTNQMYQNNQHLMCHA